MGVMGVLSMSTRRRVRLGNIPRMSSSFYPPARPLSVGEVLDLVFQIFKATLVKGLPYGICAVVAQQLPNIYSLASGVAVRQSLAAGQPIGVALFVAGVLLALVAWSALLLQQRAIIEQRPTSIKSELGESLRRLPSFFVATLLFLVLVGERGRGDYDDAASVSERGAHPR